MSVDGCLELQQFKFELRASGLYLRIPETDDDQIKFHLFEISVKNYNLCRFRARQLYIQEIRVSPLFRFLG